MSRKEATQQHFSEESMAPLSFIQHLLQDESGQDLIEYALVAALLGLGAVLSMRTLATKISNAFTSIGTTLSSNI